MTATREGYIGTMEAARLAGVSHSTLFHQIERGTLAAIRPSPRKTMIHMDEFARWLAWYRSHTHKQSGRPHQCGICAFCGETCGMSINHCRGCPTAERIEWEARQVRGEWDDRTELDRREIGRRIEYAGIPEVGSGKRRNGQIYI